MDKKYLIILIITVLTLIIFFFPKYCGNWGTTGPDANVTFHDCTCLGIFKGEIVQPFGGGTTHCWGIVTSKLCYENRWHEDPPRYYKPCP